MLPVHRTRFSIFNYDEIPPGYYYKAMLNGSPTQKFWHRKKFEEVAARIGENDRVLDIGCGPGSFLAILGDLKKGVRATGVDIASSQIQFAIENIASRFSGDRIGFVQFEGRDDGGVELPFEDETFDKITMIEVIEHIHPYIALKTLEEAKRVLKKDGRIILTTPNYLSHWVVLEWILEKRSLVKYHDQHISKFTPNSITKFLEGAGLEIMKFNTIFVLAPFLAGLNQSLASRLHGMESKSRLNLGSILIAETRPLDLKLLN
jgi:SAM-dependent methyltransferase